MDNHILILNSFLKKEIKQYKAEIKKAENIVKTLCGESNITPSIFVLSPCLLLLNLLLEFQQLQ